MFATLGSLGDLHPYIAVARALVERGHEAVIATGEDYRDQIGNAGIEFALVRTSISELGLPPSKVMAMFEGQFSPLRKMNWQKRMERLALRI